ncbi:unnamed protein product [Periconia digitata]|uniref:Uncharacterized protein n=1 Tax=Periconia digitata TaxID=1303443 RepID=A0A9W4XNV1_9PLEO|nr:unnamed protein product [Periconia digitata]
METTTERLPAYAFPDGHPTSPPMTPGTRLHTQSRYPPQTSQTSPIYRKLSIAQLAQSPPLEFIVPIGNGPGFNFTRLQSRGASSRPSTACATTPRDSEDDASSSSSEEDSNHPHATHNHRLHDSHQQQSNSSRRIDEADVSFILEELNSSDAGYASDVEVVHPDHFSDAKSDRSESILSKFKEMQVLEDSSDEEERERIYRRKKKRWSAGIFKRSHSQSIEGDSSYSDNDPLDDVDSTARRLRRRVRGPTDRRQSLVFEDRGFANSNNIAEVEEPVEGYILHSKGPPSIPSDDAFTLDELPFWEVEETDSVGAEETMDVEYESS